MGWCSVARLYHTKPAIQVKVTHAFPREVPPSFINITQTMYCPRRRFNQKEQPQSAPLCRSLGETAISKDTRLDTKVIHGDLTTTGMTEL